MREYHRKTFEEAKPLHDVDQGVIIELERVQNRIQSAIEAYKDATLPEHKVAFNIQQSMLSLKKIRDTVLHG